MKIRVTKEFHDITYKDCEDYAGSILYRSAEDQGALEDIECTAFNATEAIGRLLDLLATKGLITAPEIAVVVESYIYPETVVSFIDEDDIV